MPSSDPPLLVGGGRTGAGPTPSEITLFASRPTRGLGGQSRLKRHGFAQGPRFSDRELPAYRARSLLGKRATTTNTWRPKWGGYHGATLRAGLTASRSVSPRRSSDLFYQPAARKSVQKITPLARPWDFTKKTCAQTFRIVIPSLIGHYTTGPRTGREKHHLKPLQDRHPVAFRKCLESEEALQSDLSVFCILHPSSGVLSGHCHGFTSQNPSLSSGILASDDSIAQLCGEPGAGKNAQEMRW